MFKMFKQNLVRSKEATENSKQKWFLTIITSNEHNKQRVKKNTEAAWSYILMKNCCI